MVFVTPLPDWEQKAADLALEKHWGQKDKAGDDYWTHTARVASMVDRCGGNHSQVIAAHLHDIVEDTDLTLGDLQDEFDFEVVDIVEALTHRKGEPNSAYYERIKAVPDAVMVKLCDIYDNLDPVRLEQIEDEGTRARLRHKYATAMIALEWPRWSES